MFVLLLPVTYLSQSTLNVFIISQHYSESLLFQALRCFIIPMHYILGIERVYFFCLFSSLLIFLIYSLHRHILPSLWLSHAFRSRQSSLSDSKSSNSVPTSNVCPFSSSPCLYSRFIHCILILLILHDFLRL